MTKTKGFTEFEGGLHIEMESAPGGVTYKLKYPLMVNGERLAELQIRQPKAKEIAVMSPGAGFIKLMAKLTGQPTGVIEDLNGYDYMKLDKIISGFLGSKDEESSE